MRFLASCAACCGRLTPVLLLLAAPSCFLSESAIDESLDPVAIASIQPGASAADVSRALGAPTRVVELGDASAWLYEHVVEKQAAAFFLILGLRGVESQADRCWVFFDEHGVVTHLGASLNADQASYELPGF